MLKIVREQILSRQSALFVDVPTILQEKPRKYQKGKGKHCAAGDLDNRQAERMPRKCLRCVSNDHLIAKSLKPLKENYKQQKEVHFNERFNRIPHK